MKNVIRALVYTKRNKISNSRVHVFLVFIISRLIVQHPTQELRICTINIMMNTNFWSPARKISRLRRIVVVFQSLYTYVKENSPFY